MHFISALLAVTTIALIVHAQSDVTDGYDGSVYAGCWTDQSNPRTLSVGYPAPGGPSTGTVEVCLDGCLSLGYSIAGLEYYYQCFCDNTMYSGSYQTPESDCNTPCNGNNSEWCGGPNRLSLYYLNSAASSTTVSTATPIHTGSPPNLNYAEPGNYRFLGCFTDNKVLNGGDRTLTHNYLADSMWVEECAYLCNTYAGSSYMGVEDGTQCYCDNQIEGTNDLASDVNDCNIYCEGNSTELCGGYGYISVYSQDTSRSDYPADPNAGITSSAAAQTTSLSPSQLSVSSKSSATSAASVSRALAASSRSSASSAASVSRASASLSKASASSVASLSKYSASLSMVQASSIASASRASVLSVKSSQSAAVSISKASAAASRSTAAASAASSHSSRSSSVMSSKESASSSHSSALSSRSSDRSSRSSALSSISSASSSRLSARLSVTSSQLSASSSRASARSSATNSAQAASISRASVSSMQSVSREIASLSKASASSAAASSRASVLSSKSAAAAIPAPTVEAYRLVGCFDSTSNNPALGIHPTVKRLTLELCADKCFNHTYFGVASGTQCYCGDTSVADSVDPSSCFGANAYACVGNTAESCGADTAMPIYGQARKIGACPAPTVSGIACATVTGSVTTTYGPAPTAARLAPYGVGNSTASASGGARLGSGTVSPGPQSTAESPSTPGQTRSTVVSNNGATITSGNGFGGVASGAGRLGGGVPSGSVCVQRSGIMESGSMVSIFPTS